MTSHFNKLTEAEQERLSLLLEECGEVLQIIGKIQRHGYESCHPQDLTTTNRNLLEKELGDLIHSIHSLEDTGDVNKIVVKAFTTTRGDKVKQYLHHQEHLDDFPATL